MILKKKVLVFSLIFISIFNCFGNNKIIKIVETMNNKVYIEIKSITNRSGIILGFVAEIQNMELEKLILPGTNFLEKNIITFYKDGNNISPIPPKAIITPYDSEKFKDVTILPMRKYCYFIPLPKKVRKNPKKLINKNNLHLIPNGKYTIDFSIFLGYFIGKKENYKNGIGERFMLEIPKIPITINNEFLDENIEKIYKENKEN